MKKSLQNFVFIANGNGFASDLCITNEKFAQNANIQFDSSDEQNYFFYEEETRQTMQIKYEKVSKMYHIYVIFARNSRQLIN